MTQRFDRRTFLRGAGTAAIALPLSVTRQRIARAATAPERFITVFWGQGMPPELTAGGFSDVLAPLKPFESKLTMIRGIMAPGNSHTAGSATFACARPTKSLETKGGPSIDWVAREHFGGDTALPALSTGVYKADKGFERMRVVHTWRGVGQPIEPIPDPLVLFHQVFGGREISKTMATGTGDGGRRARIQVSVLDAVMKDYQHAMSDAGGYGRAARQALSTHAETVRELEKRAVSLTQQSGAPPPVAGGVACKGGTPPESGDVTATPGPDYWTRVWPVITDIYVTALRCDVVRFGNLLVQSGGDKFAWPNQRGDVHNQIFHAWPENGVKVREVLGWGMARIGELLAKMDDPRFPDADGKTLLDNTTILMGSELGDPSRHSTSKMTFLLAGSRGRFKKGVHDFGDRSDVDLYRSVLTGLGVPAAPTFGDPTRFRELLPILA